MAIVSISRIQHRRGLQQDLPQLASAEIGWSLDEQRLFIGNGSLAEGAPRLGNTEILTEHSDILQLAETYTFKNEDAGYNPATGGRTNRFNSIAYGNGIYIIVGNGGSLLCSYDAITWNPVYGGTSSTLNSICYGNGLFVAVGAGGTIIYSEDGSVWNKSTSTALLTLTAVAYAGGSIQNFVAVSNTGEIIVSADAITWSNASGWNASLTISNQSLNAVAYNATDDIIAIAGNNGIILTSADSNNYTLQTTPTSYNLQTISWDNDQWVAGGEFSTVLISTDGMDWIYGFTDTFRAAADNGARMIYVGDGGVIYYASTTTLNHLNQ